MRNFVFVGGGLVLFGAVGCSGSDRAERYRAALDKAKLSLADSVSVAELEAQNGVGVRAALLIDAEPVYRVGALATESVQDFHVDIVNGSVLSKALTSEVADACPGSVSLNDAIAIAERAAGGHAVSIAPDDDWACNREVKVLSSDTIWEVKVAPDGRVLEKEEDDDDD